MEELEPRETKTRTVFLIHIPQVFELERVTSKPSITYLPAINVANPFEALFSYP